jgi:hypothetical protein
MEELHLQIFMLKELRLSAVAKLWVHLLLFAGRIQPHSHSRLRLAPERLQKDGQVLHLE